MKGNEQVIGVLNQVLRKELTGINQYFIHAKMCQNWGYERLYKVLWEESIGEMKHADEIMSASFSSKVCPISRPMTRSWSARASSNSWKTISVLNQRL